MRCAVLAIAATGCVTAIHVSHHATIADDAAAAGFDLAAQDGRHVTLAGELAQGPVVLDVLSRLLVTLVQAPAR